MATKSTPFTLTVKEATGGEVDFFPVVDPSQLEVSPGQLATFAVRFDITGGFTGSVNLAVVGLPEGVTAEFDRNPIDVAETVMVTIDTAALPAGVYDLTLESTTV